MRIYTAFAVSALLALAGCTTYQEATPQQVTLSPGDAEYAARYVAPASNPNLCPPEYPECMATGFSLQADIDTRSGGGVSASNGQRAPGSPTRTGGKNIPGYGFVAPPPAPQAVAPPPKSATLPTEAKTATPTPAPAPAAGPMEENALELNQSDCASLAQVQNPSEGIKAILAQCAGGAEPSAHQGTKAAAGFLAPVMPSGS